MLYEAENIGEEGWGEIGVDIHINNPIFVTGTYMYLHVHHFVQLDSAILLVKPTFATN
jgi:hypothetical protein